MIDDIRENIQTFLNGESEGEMIAPNVFGNLAIKKSRSPPTIWKPGVRFTNFKVLLHILVFDLQFNREKL